MKSNSEEEEMQENQENGVGNTQDQNPQKPKKKKKVRTSKLVGTLFRNGLKSNLDLTSLADSKAGILISINGFILTVIVTASGFAVQNPIMNYAFAAIIVTSLVSIVLSVLAIRPRHKEQLIQKSYLEDYNSLLYFQDMAQMTPKEYKKQMEKTIQDAKLTSEAMTMHLHILGSEIKKKYFWLKQAYLSFSLGLIISVSLVVYGLMYVEQSPFYNISKGNISYKDGKFFNIFEPSGATTLPDGKVLIVEDENSNALKLLSIEADGKVTEIGRPEMSKKIKKTLKKDIEDLEAVTSNENIIYAITSHSRNKNGKQKGSREQLVRMEYENGKITSLHVYSRLAQVLHNSFPKLFEDNLFHTQGIDIEGLCFDGSSQSLFVAFRSPLFGAKAVIIGITNPEAIFKGEAIELSEPMFLDLNSQGIRDITYDTQKNGFWIIAGSKGAREERFELWFWDRKNYQLYAIGNQPDIGYAEGITVVKKFGQTNLLIVQDNGKKPNKAANYTLIDRDSI